MTLCFRIGLERSIKTKFQELNMPSHVLYYILTITSWTV